MERKTTLSESEINEFYNIIKSNMEQIGVKVTNEDKTIWCSNLREILKDKNYYFYEIVVKNKVEGFVSVILKNGIYKVGEVQLSEKIKHTRVILNIIKYLFSCSELKNAQEIQFTILKQNNMSNKTFTHLGGELIKSNDIKNYYSLSRDAVKKYLEKLK